MVPAHHVRAVRAGAHGEPSARGEVRSAACAILAKMRHDGCGGRAGKAELLSGIEGVSSRPVRRILLREGRERPVIVAIASKKRAAAKV